MAGESLMTARRLSVVTAAVGAAAGGWTLADPGLLHGPEAMQGSARGTALVLLVVALPVLLGSWWKAGRGSGAALLGSALWAVGHLVVADELRVAGEGVAERAPVRGVAAYVWVVATLNALAWLARIVPSLGEYPTPMLEGTGVQTNAIYVQDLAVWLPLAAVSALWLWRREARGGVVVTALLGMWVIESLSIAVDQWVGATADPASGVVSMSLVVPFLVLAAVGLVPWWLLARRASPLLTRSGGPV